MNEEGVVQPKRKRDANGKPSPCPLEEEIGRGLIGHDEAAIDRQQKGGRSLSGPNSFSDGSKNVKHLGGSAVMDPKKT